MDLWPFRSRTSGCADLALVVPSRRGQAAKDAELVLLVLLCHQVRARERQVNGRVRYRPLTAPSWLRSAGCSPGNTGELSWSGPRLFCVSAEKLDAGKGGHGGADEARDGQR